jgi:hypothetical protein
VATGKCKVKKFSTAHSAAAGLWTIAGNPNRAISDDSGGRMSGMIRNTVHIGKLCMRAAICLAVSAMVFATAAFGQEVTCESKGSKRTECPMDTSGEVRVVRQLSKAACTEGSTWGVSKHSVWVEGGCRAVFGKGEDEAAAAPPQSGGLPRLNAECPGGLSVHADEGGPIYVNGKEAKLKQISADYFEARDAASGTTVSLSRNPDGTMTVSYTGRGKDNGMCQVSR